MNLYNEYGESISTDLTSQLLFDTRFNQQTIIANQINTADILLTVRGMMYLELFTTIADILSREASLTQEHAEILPDEDVSARQFTMEGLLAFIYQTPGIYWRRQDTAIVYVLVRERIDPTPVFHTNTMPNMEWRMSVRELETASLDSLSFLERHRADYKRLILPTMEGDVKSFATSLLSMAAFRFEKVRERIRQIVGDRLGTYSRIKDVIEAPAIDVEEVNFRTSAVRFLIEVVRKGETGPVPIRDVDDLYEVFRSVQCNSSLLYSRLNLAQRNMIRTKSFYTERVDVIDSLFKVYNITRFDNVRRELSIPIVTDSGEILLDDAAIASIDRIRDVVLHEDTIRSVLMKDPIARSLEFLLAILNPEYTSRSRAATSRLLHPTIQLVQTRDSPEYREFTRFTEFEYEENKTIAVVDVPSQLTEPGVRNLTSYIDISRQLRDVIADSIPELVFTENLRIGRASYSYDIPVSDWNMPLFFLWVTTDPDMSRIFVPALSALLPSEDPRVKKRRKREVRLPRAQTLADSIRLQVLTSLSTTTNNVDSVVESATMVAMRLSIDNGLRLRIHIRRAPTLDVVSAVREVVTATITIFLMEYDTIRARYLPYMTIDEVNQIGMLDATYASEQVRETRQAQTKGMANAKAIELVAPDLVVGGSSRTCSNRMAMYITEEEIPRIESLGLDVMPFPPVNPTMYFTVDTSSESKPLYPGVTLNYAVNSRKYPYMPCAQGTHYYTDRSLWHQYRLQLLEGDEYVPGPLVREHSLLKPLGENAHAPHWQPALLSNNLQRLLHGMTKTRYDSFMRIGSPFSINSALHCILYALQDTDYLESNYKDDYVKGIRRDLTRTVPVEVMSQELYGLSPDQMRFLLEKDEDDDESFSYWFDMRVFYRIVEEYFQVNLILFAYDNKNATSTLLPLPFDQTRLERPLRDDRPTIMLVEMKGTPQYRTPQYNLITGAKESRETVGDTEVPRVDATIVFPQGALIDIKAQRYDNVYVSESNRYELQVTPRLFESLDLYPHLVRKDIPITAQIIDSHGKCRAIEIEYNNERITVGCAPCQPIVATSASEVYQASVQSAMRLFGKPDSVSLDRGRVRYLMWEKKSVPYISVEVEPIPIESLPFDATISEEEPFVAQLHQVPPIDRATQVKQKTYFFLQYMYWVFGVAHTLAEDAGQYIAYESQQGVHTAPDFASLLEIADATAPLDINMADSLDFTDVRAALPQVETTQEAVDHLAELNIGLTIEIDGTNYFYIPSYEVIRSAYYYWYRLVRNFPQFKLVPLGAKYTLTPDERSRLLDIVPDIIYDTHVSEVVRELPQQIGQAVNSTILFRTTWQVTSWVEAVLAGIDTKLYRWEQRRDRVHANSGQSQAYTGLIEIMDTLPPSYVLNELNPILYSGDILGLGYDILLIVQRTVNESPEYRMTRREPTPEELGANSLVRAYNTSLTWIEERVNIGPRSTLLLEDETPKDVMEMRRKLGLDTSPLWNRSYMLYSIIDGKIRISRSHLIAGQTGEVPHILQLNEAYYAALLPLQDIQIAS